MTAPMIALPHWRAGLSLATLLLASGGAVHAASVPCLALAAGTGAARAPVAGAPALPASLLLGEEVFWSSEHFSADANGDTELNGNVTLRVGGRELHGDRLN